MITDKQRRDIAQKLRDVATECYNYGVLESDVLNILGVYATDNACLVSSDSVMDVADIIDRPTCHDVTDLDRESFKCLRCGYRVLSIDGAPDAAKLVSPKGGVVDFGYCPNCGAEVVE